MDITNPYVLFHPNYIASKKEKMKLEKILKLNNDDLFKNYIKKPKNLKIWRVENKEAKKYVAAESRYRLKQVVKLFNMNQEELNHGYSNRYINLFTDLLTDKNQEKYAQRRLALAYYRKKILKKKLNISFEDYMRNEKGRNPRTKNSSIYITATNLKTTREGYKYKPSYYSNINQTYSKIFNKNRILIKKSILKKKGDNSNKLNIKNLFSKRENTMPSFEANMPLTARFSKSNLNYVKDEDENDYFEKSNPKEEFIERRNKFRYLDYLKAKYKFYTCSNFRELKKCEQNKKRQILLYTDKDKIEFPLKFPYKKEFFKRYYRKNNKQILNN